MRARRCILAAITLDRDKVVLLFFPLAFSPTCTTEMRTMRDGWEEWSKLGAQVSYEELLGLKGVGKRAAFVIGREGTVVYDWVSEDAGREPDYEEIRTALEAA